VNDIDTAVVDSLKVLDPERPIREADIGLSSVGIARVEPLIHQSWLVIGM
jgi:hypothetical protein